VIPRGQSPGGRIGGGGLVLPRSIRRVPSTHTRMPSSVRAVKL
jgi:hypothetical protein